MGVDPDRRPIVQGRSAGVRPDTLRAKIDAVGGFLLVAWLDLGNRDRATHTKA